jgi:peptidyl-prolyl cis-trans isomerase A (cyclophilin A)
VFRQLGLCRSYAPNGGAQSELVRVGIETSGGVIEAEIDVARAPITAANFLRYVDARMYDNGQFHRAVRLDNQVRKDVLIEVVQGGRRPESTRTRADFDPIPLEPTSSTMLKHVDGALSMARGNTTNSAPSGFFICIGTQPSLDAGDARAADGQGLAVFGRVVSGMDIVGRTQSGRSNDREQLIEPVRMVRIYQVG